MSSHPSPGQEAPHKPRRAQKSLLVAAFSGLAIALGWEDQREESAYVLEAGNDEDWLNFDYGQLERLDSDD